MSRSTSSLARVFIAARVQAAALRPHIVAAHPDPKRKRGPDRSSPVSSLTLRVAIVFSVLTPGVSDAQDAAPPRRMFRESVAVATDSQVAKRLGTARDHLEAQQWGEAIPILQQLIETSGNTLLPVETGRYWNTTDFCHLLISRLPEAGLTVYRARVDPHAAELLEQADRTLDPALYERVVTVAFNSSSGDDALWRLGSLAFEQGRYAVARQHWQLLVAPVRPTGNADQELAESPYLTYPDSAFAVELVRARLILCTIFEGDGERAERELEVFEKRHPDAEGTLAGQTGPLADILRKTLQQSRAWWLGRSVPNEVLTFAGQPTRDPLPAQDHSPGSRLWTRKLPQIQFRGPVSPALRGPQWLLSYNPVVYRDTVYLCTSHSIFALDLATGDSPRWPGEPQTEAAGTEPSEAKPGSGEASEKQPPGEAGEDQPAGSFTGERTPIRDADQEQTRIFTNSTEESFRVIRNPVGITRYTMTVADGRLYARMGPPISRRSPHEGSAISEIVGLDIENGQGLLVFRVTSDILDPDATSPEATAWSFEGTPVVENGRVYVSARRGTPEDEIAVACFDAASSQLLWQQRVCSNLTTVSDRSSLLDHRLLTLGDGRLFLATGTGAIASLDAATGRILWIVTYDSGTGPGRATSVLDKVNHPARNGLMPCVYHRGMVFAATTDASRLFALDATTGQLVWQVEQSPGEWLRHLLGVVDGRLIACGNQLVAFDIFTGETRWKISHPNPDAWTHGRGVLTPYSVYWPTRREITRVSIRSGGIQRRYQLTQSDGLQGGNLLIAGGRMLLVTHDRITALRNLARPARAVGDPEELGQLPPDEGTARGLRIARASEDAFRPDVAAAHFRSVLKRTASPDLFPERRRQLEHVSARGLVRTSRVLAEVSSGAARHFHFQSASKTTEAHAWAFSPTERIRSVRDLAESAVGQSAADLAAASQAVRQFVDEAALDKEPWLAPLKRGEPVQETVAAVLHRDVGESAIHDPEENGHQVIRRVSTPLGQLFRRSWTQPISDSARVLVATPAGDGTAARLLIQDTTLKCVDAGAGRTLWETAMPDAVSRAFLISRGNPRDESLRVELLLVGQRSLQYRDADTGRSRWSSRWTESVEFFVDEMKTGSPRLLCATAQSVSALDVRSGAALWSFPPEFQQVSLPDTATRDSHSTLFRNRSAALFRPRGFADAFLLDLRTGFPQARVEVTSPLPRSGQLIVNDAGEPVFEAASRFAASPTGWSIIGISESRRLSWSRFESGDFSRRTSRRKMGNGLHVPLLLDDEPPWSMLIENGLVAERIDARTGGSLWRVSLGSPLEAPREMTALTDSALFAAVSGFLKRIALSDGSTEWKRHLGEGSWRIVEATAECVCLIGHRGGQNARSELVFCDAQTGEPVQRFRFVARVGFNDVHVGPGFLLVRAGDTLHCLAAWVGEPSSERRLRAVRRASEPVE